MAAGFGGGMGKQQKTCGAITEYYTTECKDLIGCDLNTPEGSEKFKADNLMETVCAGCVQKSVQIVESITN